MLVKTRCVVLPTSMVLIIRQILWVDQCKLLPQLGKRFKLSWYFRQSFRIVGFLRWQVVNDYRGNRIIQCEASFNCKFITEPFSGFSCLKAYLWSGDDFLDFWQVYVSLQRSNLLIWLFLLLNRKHSCKDRNETRSVTKTYIYLHGNIHGCRNSN